MVKYQVKINDSDDVEVFGRTAEDVASKIKKNYNDLNFVVIQDYEPSSQKIFGFDQNENQVLLLKVRRA